MKPCPSNSIILMDFESTNPTTGKMYHPLESCLNHSLRSHTVSETPKKRKRKNEITTQLRNAYRSSRKYNAHGLVDLIAAVH